MANSGNLSRRRSSSKGNTGVLISQHYLEIEYLLDLVENSTSHYQTLGLDRTATDEQIVKAYHEAIGVLHPSYHKVRAAQTDEMLSRIDNAFKKISQAFITLTNARSRSEYDQSFKRRSDALPKVDAPKPRLSESSTARTAKTSVERNAKNVESKATASDDAEPNGSESKSIPVRMSHASMSDAASVAESTAFSKPSLDPNANRRRIERYTISLPALVAGCNSEGGKWQEMTKSFDLSRIGIGIKLKKRVWPGMVLHLTMPMPTRLRTHGYSDPAYKIYAIVRRVEPINDGMRVVGLEFLGERPPSFYLHKPWATFRTQEWSGADRRCEPRASLSEGVIVEYFNEAMEMIGRETAWTENVSSSGARIHVKNLPADFEWVRVLSQRRHFDSLALLRNRYPGRDGDERLCLQFTENKWPVI
ncbi:MAG: DnaJ domain-containing protein [Acidobacteriota bacterium]